MAVRFSAVKLTANEQECKLLVSGVPTSLGDLEGWKMFETFVGELDEDTKINVQVDTYLYGEGEIFDATPEEVAYMMMRQADNSDFLNSRKDGSTHAVASCNVLCASLCHESAVSAYFVGKSYGVEVV